ncbi:hypothetical protein ILYODFUR_025728 [Ilyodon furcidens]|uniref:Uncharacterized protein n=1 Tax=Ilyodon furcidens TaxID=33524 RepID=A0ABV0UM03_9TELE
MWVSDILVQTPSQLVAVTRLHSTWFRSTLYGTCCVSTDPLMAGAMPAEAPPPAAYHHRVLDAQLPNLSALQQTAYLLETWTFHPRTDHPSWTPFLPATRTFHRSRPEFLIHVISLLNKSLKNSFVS